MISDRAASSKTWLIHNDYAGVCELRLNSFAALLQTIASWTRRTEDAKQTLVCKQKRVCATTPENLCDLIHQGVDTIQKPFGSNSTTCWSSQSRRWLRFQFQGCTVLNLYRTDPYYMTLQKQMKHAYAKPYMQVQLEGKKRKGKESLPHWSSLNVVKSLAWNCQLDAQFNMHAHNSYLSVQA